LRIAGGNPAATGGIMLLFGSTHATKPNAIELTADGTGYISMSTNSVTRLTIANSGAATFSSSVQAGSFKIVNVSTTEYGINSENNQGYIGTTTDHGFNIMTNNTPRLTISNGGAATFSSSVTLTNELRVKTATTSGVGLSKDSSGAYLYNIDNTFLAFGTNDTERLRIAANGAATFSSSVTANGNGAFNTTSAVSGYALDVRAATNKRFGVANSNSLSGASVLFYTDANAYADGYIDATKLILQSQSAGSVGIGTSSISTTSTPHLFIKNNNISMFGGGSRDSYIGTNFYFNSAWYYRGTGGASMTQYDDDAIIFKNAASGSANASLTWSERLRITSAGDMYLTGRSTNGDYGMYFYSNDTDSRIYSSNSSAVSKPIQFYTSGTERMRITSAGNVQIANGGDLILGPASSGGNVTLFNDNGYLQCDTVATFASELRSGGITDNGAYNLQCNGTGVWGAGAYVNGSDIALKENILDIEKALDLVLNLKPKSFTYKEDYSKDQSIQTGFIAQDLLETLKDQIYVDGIVSKGKNHLNVAYQNLIPLLTKAIQEQQQQIEELKSKLN